MCRYLLAFLPALFIHSGCGAEGTITGDGCLSGDDCAEPEESATLSFVDDASGTPPGVVPANPNATAGARQLLQRITDNTSAPRRKVGSGLHLGSWKTFHTDPAGAMEDYNDLETETGENPWLIGVDYDANPASPATYPGGYSAVNAVLIDHYTVGGAVSISIHAYNPCTGGRFDDLDCDIEKLITPGTTEYNNWRAQLDEYAIGLEALRVAGVPVLWRPFHEMNRSPFWWTHQNTTMTTGRFHTLWRQTYDYLTNTKGLNNLLWVFAPSTKERSGVGGTENWYPGDDYVDVIGMSNYLGGTTTQDDRDDQLAFTQAIPNKPFAITECCRNGNESNYDNSVFLDELTDNYQYVSYFMFWKDSKAPTESPNASVLFNDPLIDNR